LAIGFNYKNKNEMKTAPDAEKELIYLIQLKGAKVKRPLNKAISKIF
jgi:hypothetical protein